MDESEALKAEIERLRAALGESERKRELMEAVVERAPLGIALFDKDGFLRGHNRALAQLFDLQGQAAVGRFNILNDPESEGRLRSDYRRVYAGESVESAEFAHGLPARPWRAQATTAWYDHIVFPLLDGDASVAHVVAFVRDISERKRVEQLLFEAQRHESLALLSGRIAHDFNNVLASILANASLAMSHPRDGALVGECLESVVSAAELATGLTRQLLGYAGKGRFAQQVTDLSVLAREMGQLLTVSLAKKVALRYELAEELPAVRVDATQMRQVVMNLITNAADAIGDQPGTISLRTRACSLTGPELSTLRGADSARPGRFVCVAVRDSGAGMDEATLGRMFDPFFTTKAKGYGLGLAATLGIIRNHGGALQVESGPGQGTTVSVFLPALAATQVPEERPVSTAPARRGGRVLVVDDEPMVRSVISRALALAGYEVHTAKDGERALAMARDPLLRPDLVLLDMNMPVLSGRQTLQALLASHGRLAVLLMSGYDDADIDAAQYPSARVRFMRKPFQLGALLENTAELVAESAAVEPAP